MFVVLVKPSRPLVSLSLYQIACLNSWSAEEGCNTPVKRDSLFGFAGRELFLQVAPLLAGALAIATAFAIDIEWARGVSG